MRPTVHADPQLLTIAFHIDLLYNFHSIVYHVPKPKAKLNLLSSGKC